MKNAIENGKTPTNGKAPVTGKAVNKLTACAARGAAGVIAAKNKVKLTKIAAGKTFAAALLALIPALAILLGCALFAAPALAQDKAPAAPSATAEVALPDIKEGKTDRKSVV